MGLPFPTVRLELEGMRLEIVHALTSYHTEIEEAVKVELAHAIATYPFDEQVKLIANEAITDAIKKSVDHYFNYGDGFALIDRVVRDAVEKALRGQK